MSFPLAEHVSAQKVKPSAGHCSDVHVSPSAQSLVSSHDFVDSPSGLQRPSGKSAMLQGFKQTSASEARSTVLNKAAIAAFRGTSARFHTGTATAYQIAGLSSCTILGPKVTGLCRIGIFTETDAPFRRREGAVILTFFCAVEVFTGIGLFD